MTAAPRLALAGAIYPIVSSSFVPGTDPACASRSRTTRWWPGGWGVSSKECAKFHLALTDPDHPAHGPDVTPAGLGPQTGSHGVEPEQLDLYLRPGPRPPPLSRAEFTLRDVLLDYTLAG